MSTVESYTQGTPCWIDLTTSDAAAALEFYGGLFGWSYDSYPMGPPESGLTYYMATIRGGNVAGLMQHSDDDAGDVRWNTYLAVDDADAAAERAVSAGGTLLFPVDEVPGSGRMAVTTDPTGVRISFWQQKGHIGSAVVNEPGAVIWNELQSPRFADALPFYASAVGLEAKIEPMGGVSDYTVFTSDGRSVAGATDSTVSPDGSLTTVEASGWFVYFAVDDVDVSVAKALGLGATLAEHPVTVEGVGRFAQLSDPQGGLFYVMT